MCSTGKRRTRRMLLLLLLVLDVPDELFSDSERFG